MLKQTKSLISSGFREKKKSTVILIKLRWTFWRRGRDSDSRGSPPLGHRGSDSLLKAVIHYRSVRILSIKNKKEHLAASFCFWRRGRDSNPCALSRKLISSVIASRYLAVFYEKIREPEIPAIDELTGHFDCFCEKFRKKLMSRCFSSSSDF